MKLLKLILLELLTALLIFALISCNEGQDEGSNGNICSDHLDQDGNLFCDICGFSLSGDEAGGESSSESENEDKGSQENESEVLRLIEGGKSRFVFIYEKGVPSDVIMTLDSVIESGKKIGLDFSSGSENLSVTDKIEVLVGQPSGRGEEYAYDIHSLGPKGYAIRILSGRVQLLGGSYEALVDAIEIFKEDYLKITRKTKVPEDVFLTSEMTSINPQTKYSASSATALGIDLGEFSFYVESGDYVATDFAKYLQEYIYSHSGRFLEITDDNTKENIISFSVQKPTGALGFSITAVDGRVDVVCQYPDKLKEAAFEYFAVDPANKVIDIPLGLFEEKNLRDVYYSDFGAVGDGKANDFKAIYDTHVYANKHGHYVYADEGKTYYIGSATAAIPIKTNTDFGNATFIIDDSFIDPDMPERDIWLFQVLSDNAPFTFTEKTEGFGDIIKAINESGGIKRDAFDKLDLGLGYSAMIIIKNDDHKNYIRYGANANDGAAQSELVLVDEQGNVSINTPLLFDYEKVTSITVYKIDDEQIKVSGGIFKTIANQAPSEYTYYKRGFQILRHNAIIDGIMHTVEGEGETGAPYNGFISVVNTNNVTVRNCRLSGRKTYRNSAGVSMGSYDISIGNSNNTLFEDCTQINFFSDEENKIISTGIWGIGGSNYAKNLTYNRCRLSRFDAHCGVYNANLLNSEVSAINLIGGGTALIENTKLYTNGNTLITLREDFGSTWNGKIIIKDVTMITAIKYTTVNLISAAWVSHDFGYRTYLPEIVEVDNFVCEGAKKVNVFTGGIKTGLDIASDEINPVSPAKLVNVKNNLAELSYSIPDSKLFAETVLKEE